MTDPDSVQPETLVELTESETGIWEVLTRDSCYLFDLDDDRVIRRRGLGAPVTVNDRTRLLRSIDTCRVSERGRWTMHSESWSASTDYFWQISSDIRRIEQVTDPNGTDGHAKPV